MIFLIGYMGCGKTTTGRKLAKRLNLPFIDLDKSIESKYGQTITEIFHEKGEPGFRTIERDVLLEILSGLPAVISLGGGTPCFFDNLLLMQSKGKIIYLKMSAESLATRLLSAKTNRPLIAGKSEDELIAYISESLIHREPYYRQADIIINGVNLKMDELISRLDLNP